LASNFLATLFVAATLLWLATLWLGKMWLETKHPLSLFAKASFISQECSLVEKKF
jgi:hypothetical protein